MSFFGSKKPRMSDYVIARLGDRGLQCTMCGYEMFSARSYKLETNASVSFGPMLFAATSLTLECVNCGFHLQFAEENKVQVLRIPYKPDSDELDVAAAGSVES